MDDKNKNILVFSSSLIFISWSFPSTVTSAAVSLVMRRFKKAESPPQAQNIVQVVWRPMQSHFSPMHARFDGQPHLIWCVIHMIESRCMSSQCNTPLSTKCFNYWGQTTKYFLPQTSFPGRQTGLWSHTYCILTRPSKGYFCYQ